MSYYQPSRFQVLPPVVKNLLIINALFFLATLAFESAFRIDLTEILGLHYFASTAFKPYQFVTYMFMHGGFTHILFNMFALWMFGNNIENVWGGKRFLIYYMVTGIGAGIIYMIWIHFQMSPDLKLMEQFISSANIKDLHEILTSHVFRIDQNSGMVWEQYQIFERNLQTISNNPDNAQALRQAVEFIQSYREYYMNQSVVVGASGAVFGILLAFGMMFPNAIIYIYFAFPLKAKYFVILYGLFELFEGVMNRPGNNIAHFAHLGGMFFGYFLILYWRKKGELY
ncbi:MAG TPA: rhomboid family intramembrane serine protease [Bacteroidales bacterium]|nr:rhomboid family intramembrane serine protease [Bacteroidales bacterium]HQQ13545.1 rhomboid family intramembrane serine protease [Bacteroidales bacterium]